MGDLNLLKIILILLATIFTVTYSLRLFIFLTTKSGNRGVSLGLIEVWNTSAPIRILFIFATIRGAITGWFFIPSYVVNLSFMVKIIIFGFIIFYVGYWLVMGSMDFLLKLVRVGVAGLMISGFNSRLWWLRNLAVRWFSLLNLGGIALKTIDQGWSEKFGPQGIYERITGAAFVGDGIRFIGFKKLMFGYLLFVVIV